MKRIIGWILTIAMMFSMVAVSAAEEEAVKHPFKNNYELIQLPGDKQKVVTKDHVIATDNAEVSGNGVQINAGGSATFGFSTRFAMYGVTLKFEGASGTVTITTDEHTYTINDIKGDGEYWLDFNENIGRQGQPYFYNSQTESGYYKNNVEKRGEQEIVVSTTGNLFLKEMVFEKDKTPKLSTPTREFPISAEEKALMTTVALHENASIIFVNGARRYIDVGDVTMRPIKEKGTLYIPIGTLAKALGYYYEDYPNKDYALMRSDTHEYVMIEGRHSVSQGVNDPVAPPFEAIIKRDGKTLAAVRYFAELIGETVIYDNGLVLIEDKYAANDLMKNDSLKNYLANKIKPFTVADTVGKTYYVAQNSPAASDSNTGSALAPFKTLDKAARVAAAGDTVIVREGVYRETLKPVNSGTENAPITFKAADGEEVVISANDTFDTWEKLDDGKYITKMPWDLGPTRNQVFIDDKPLNEARHPNSPSFLSESEKISNMWLVRGDMYRVEGKDTVSLDLVRSASQLWQEEDYWVGGYYVGLFGNAYNLGSANIIDSKPGELTLGAEKTALWFDAREESHYNYGYIVGHINALDAPGEWFRQDGTLYLIFPEGKTPENCTVEAKARQLVVDLDNRQFVNVEGFRTIGGGARMNYSVMCKLDNMDMNYISHAMHIADEHSGYIDFDLNSKLDENGDYQTVTKTKDGSPERGESGVYIGGRDNMFVNSKINNSALAGLYITGLYAYVDNNYMNDVGYQGNYASGISLYPKPYVTDLTGGHFIYNNTVYNCGRSNINVGEARGGSNSGFSSFLPCDIGYNDFHDGILTSADTGLTYQYYVNMGYDGLMSNEHHNYVYMTTNEKDANPYSNGIYHDGGSYGLDSFKNQVFYTQPRAGFSGHFVFEQSHPTSPANYLAWDNYKTGYIAGGVDALDAGYFVEDKPYFAGYLGGVDYTKNYDRFKAGIYGMQKTARDAELSDGINIDEESGYAAFSGDDQYIKFTDVDFGEGANQIVLSARGDSAHTGDKVEIIVGDDIETGAKYEVEAKLNAPDRDIPNRLSRTVRPMSGKHTVFVKVTEYRSLELGGLSAVNVDSGADSDEYSLYLYAGNFQEWVKFDENGTTFSPPTPLYTNAVDPGAGFLNNTWPGYYVKYEKQEFSTPTDTFMIIGGSGGSYAHQPIEIYIDGLKESNMVVKFNLAGEAWSYSTPQIYKLNRVVPAGVHDVYMKFATDDGYNKSSDMKHIGFVKEGVELKEFQQAKVKIYGGEFDKTISKPVEGYPFRAELMNPPNYTNKGLTYTLPGSVAGYKNVNIDIDATDFVISYATEPGIDGETIEVHIGSPDSEPIATLVTEGKGLLNFNDVIIELEKPIPQGQYDIYLSFSGGNGKKLNTKIDWFGFNN